MSFIIEIKEKREVQVGERYERRTPPFYGSDECRIPIMEEQVTLVLKQEVDKLDLKELVKLINRID